ncbi:amidohydrolase family protein [Rhodococcus sp. IEGM 1305]|nr:amidohydrolase family protein [Rhodococcus sp. IEGM 1305]
MSYLLVRNGNVLTEDCTGYASVDLLSRNGQIVEMAQGIEPPPDCAVIDARGRSILPGFVDCHVHSTAVTADTTLLRTLPPSYVTAGATQILGNMLARGFTTVRDVGGADFGLARAIDEGLIRGPRLIFGGKALSQTGGHGDKRSPGVQASDDHPYCGGSCRVVDGVENVRLAVREELRRGASHIKLMASGGVASPTDHINSTQYSIPELEAAVAEATAVGSYVTVHAYAPAAINRALRAGARCVEHGNLLDDDSIVLLKELNAYLVPTLVTYWALEREGREHGLSETSWRKVAEVLEGSIDALRRASDADVNIAFGSDLLGGMHKYQSEEFRIRSKVQSPTQIIRSATTVAARLLQMPDKIGILTPGAYADLLIWDADPLEDAVVLAQPDRYLEAVVKDGQLVNRPDN